MSETRDQEKVYPMQGGEISDSPATGTLWLEQENLLAPRGGGKGLRIRPGITKDLELTSAAGSGCAVFIVKLADVTRGYLVAVLHIALNEIIHLGFYADQAGRLEEPPYSGGKDPDDITEPDGEDDPGSNGLYMFVEGLADYETVPQRPYAFDIQLASVGGRDGDSMTCQYVILNVTDNEIATDVTPATGTATVTWDSDAGQLRGIVRLTPQYGEVDVDKVYAILLHSPADVSAGTIGATSYWEFPLLGPDEPDHS